MKNRIQNSLTEGAKVSEIGVTGRLYGREALGPTSTFIPCDCVETDFVDETDGIDWWPCEHECYCKLAREHESYGDTAFLRHFD